MLADAAVQKTNFGTSDGRGCTVIDLVLRRSLNDIKWPRASSYVLKTAIFPVTPPNKSTRKTCCVVGPVDGAHLSPKCHARADLDLAVVSDLRERAHVGEPFRVAWCGVV